MRALCGLLCLALSACSQTEARQEPSDMPDSGVSALDEELELGAQWLRERSVRRSVLEASLAVDDNAYARLRLEQYAMDGGWDDLPVHNPAVRAVGATNEGFEPVWSEREPFTRAALLELGARAFRHFPAQREPRLSGLLERPELLRRLGLSRDAQGRIGSLVLARYADGSEQPALTCATCHARVDTEGQLVIGAASDFDWGALVFDSEHSPWGRGRVDVTADGVDNPESIPDLRAVRHQTRLHWSGNVHNGLLELATRIETLLITSSAETVRPPRVLAFALALYLRSLGDGARAMGTADDRVFAAECSHCHSGTTGEGGLISARIVGTDRAVAESPERGTGSYRAPSLYRVADRTRLMHDGTFANLEALLDPERLADEAAHPFGLELSASERTSLLAYLETL
jgi:hypothetical protein